MAENNLDPQAQAQAELIARFNDEIRRTGDALPETRAAIAAGSAETAKILTKSAEAGAAALGVLAGSTMSVVKNLYAGQQGMKVFDGALTTVGDAAKGAGSKLFAMGGPLGIIGGIVFKLIEYFTDGAKAINEMADKQFETYQKLTKSGATAADGMTGAAADARKLGLGLKDLDKYVELVSNNSKDLAMFGGSAADGRKKLANMGKELEVNRAQFFNMGLSVDDVNEGMAGYIKQQNLTGGSMRMNDKQMAAASKNYIMEQDIMTKLTGVSRKDLEAQIADALREEQFGAMMLKIRREQGDEAADTILATRKMIHNSLGPDAAKGFGAALTGNLRDPAAQKLARTAGAETIEQINNLSKGIGSSTDVVQNMATNMDTFRTTTGENLAVIGSNNKTNVAFTEQVNAGILAKKDIAGEIGKIKAAQKAQQAGENKATDGQAKMRDKQLSVTLKLQAEMEKGIVPLQNAMMPLTNVVSELVDGLTTLVGWFFKKPPVRAIETERAETQKKEEVAAELAKKAKETGSAADIAAAKAAEKDMQKSAGEARQAEAERRKLTMDVTKARNRAKTTGKKEDIQQADILEANLKQLDEKNKKAESERKKSEEDRKKSAEKAVTGEPKEKAAEKTAPKEPKEKEAEKTKAAPSATAPSAPAPTTAKATAKPAASPATAISPMVAAEMPGAVLQSQAGVAKSAAEKPKAAPAEKPAPDKGPPAKGAVPAGEADAPTTQSAKQRSKELAPKNLTILPEADVSGINPDFLNKFYAFADKLGEPLSINSAFRDDKKQAELWVRANKLKDRGVLSPAKPKNETDINYKGIDYTVPGASPGRTSSHNAGRALDVTWPGMSVEKSSTDKLLSEFGLTRPLLGIKDVPHVEMMAKGGITKGPSIAGEAGPEAVIPLKNGAVPVDLGLAGTLLKQLDTGSGTGEATLTVRQTITADVETAIKSLADQLSKPKEAQLEMLSILRDIKRSNDATADTSVKIARAAMN